RPVLHVKVALAIAQAEEKGARALGAGDVGGGPAVVAEHPLDGRAGGLGGNAEEVGDVVDDLVARIGLGRSLVRAGVVRPRVVARTIGVAAMVVDAAIVAGVVAFDGRVAMAADRLG